MTHDELLFKIGSFMSLSVNELNQLVPNNPPAVALRAVVELHKPEHSIRGYRCTFDDELFPCKHHQAIEKELQ